MYHIKKIVHLYKKGRGLRLLLIFLIGLTGCNREVTASQLHYGAFDTVIRIYAPLGEKEADTLAEIAFAEFDRLSRLFDIYYGYTGIINLWDVNRQAAIEPIEIEPALFDLLVLGKEVYTLTEGRVNIAMGAVLSLWHEARGRGILPETQALVTAMEHCDMDNLILDQTASTVYFADPDMCIDVGAVAKGYASQLVADMLVDMGYENFLLDAGGNIVAVGYADGVGRLWNVGIQDPDGEGAVPPAVIQVTDAAVVTSGDYRRYLEVAGERYHHIIDPDTGYPGKYARSVTVICEDSGSADVLSTAFFLMPAEEAVAMADRLEVGLLIITAEGNIVENLNWLNLKK